MAIATTCNAVTLTGQRCTQGPSCYFHRGGRRSLRAAGMTNVRSFTPPVSLPVSPPASQSRRVPDTAPTIPGFTPPTPAASTSHTSVSCWDDAPHYERGTSRTAAQSGSAAAAAAATAARAELHALRAAVAGGTFEPPADLPATGRLVRVYRNGHPLERSAAGVHYNYGTDPALVVALEAATARGGRVRITSVDRYGEAVEVTEGYLVAAGGRAAHGNADLVRTTISAAALHRRPGFPGTTPYLRVLDTSGVCHVERLGGARHTRRQVLYSAQGVHSS